MNVSMKIILSLIQALIVRWNRLKTLIRSRYWKLLIEKSGGTVGANFTVRSGAFLSLPSKSSVSIGSDVTLAESAAIYLGPSALLKLEDGVFIGRGTVIAANHQVSIGKGTQIAHFVTIIDTDHQFKDTHIPLLAQGMKSSPIEIGAETWIAAHAVILKGRSIGPHCVIGAGAVVAKDVPPGAIATGNPASIRH